MQRVTRRLSFSLVFIGVAEPTESRDIYVSIVDEKQIVRMIITQTQLSTTQNQDKQQMGSNGKKDFSVAFLLRDSNNNECELAYPSNENSPSKSSYSPTSWHSIAILNQLPSNVSNTPSSFWLAGTLNYSMKTKKSCILNDDRSAGHENLPFTKA